MEEGRNISGGNGGHASGGSQKVGNVSVQIGDKEGIYVGSATNMTRLFIMCNIVWGIMFGVFAYLKGIETGNLEARIVFLESLHK